MATVPAVALLRAELSAGAQFEVAISTRAPDRPPAYTLCLCLFIPRFFSQDIVGLKGWK